MHLAAGSQFVDAGTDLGLPFSGSAPDLGCFERDELTSVRIVEGNPSSFTLEQNYPNPFNPETNIKFSVGATRHTTLTVYNLLGQRVVTLFDGVAQADEQYHVRFDARFSGRQTSAMASGVYLYKLESGTRHDIKKLLLLK